HRGGVRPPGAEGPPAHPAKSQSRRNRGRLPASAPRRGFPVRRLPANRRAVSSRWPAPARLHAAKAAPTPRRSASSQPPILACSRSSAQLQGGQSKQSEKEANNPKTGNDLGLC